ncbi:hypothetical protein Mapa_014551 [Marchantia paleacea]|nr:hypothetical protein Mapa_014551 [Marchantia paleacea]
MMEKKKKREKASPNGASGGETDGGSVQNSVPTSTYKAIRPAAPVDLLKRQREAEQVVGGPAKKLMLSGSTPPVLPFSPSQPYPPVGHWQYPPAQQPPPFVPPSQPQPTLSQGQPLQQQQQPQGQQQQGQQQQGPAQAQGGQPPTAYWGGSEFPPQSSGGQYYPFPGSSTDSNWQGPTYPGAPSVPNSLPYGYPGPYAYPAAVGQTGYTGAWPDQSWWGGNPAQQPPVFPGGYGPPYQGYGPAYGFVPQPGATGAPPLPFQRGYIKAPPGLSQKHRRLWETQSCENIQVWSSLTRAEAELGALRSKVMHLEGELHALRGQPDVGDALTIPAGLQQPGKRARHKKPGGSNNNDSGASKRGGKPTVDKTAAEGAAKSEDKSEEKECDVDDKNLGTSVKTVRKSETKVVSEIDENKSMFDSTSVRNVFEPDTCATDTSERKTLEYGDPYRSTFHSEVGLENGVNGEAHGLEKNGIVVDMTPNSSGYEVKMTGHSGEPVENNCHSGITADTVGEDWAAADDRNCSFEDRLLNYSGAVGRSNSKVISEWGEYGGDDVSDDHEVDELVPSGQDDDEDIDDEDDSGLQSIGGSKVHNLVVGLGSGKGIPPLSRW